jgi:AcrR family transcriptional regulator
MGHRHAKADILEGAMSVAFADGLSQLTFGRIAKRLGISDRIVVYYFPTKDDLIGEVLYAMGAELQATLSPTFSAPVVDHRELVRTAWPILARSNADPIFALFFEAGGLAATGREPFRSLVPQLVEAWIDWAAEFISGPRTRRRAEAEAAIAMLDGLLLLRQLAGAETADRAARRLSRNGPGRSAPRTTTPKNT